MHPLYRIFPLLFQGVQVFFFSTQIQVQKIKPYFPPSGATLAKTGISCASSRRGFCLRKMLHTWKRCACLQRSPALRGEGSARRHGINSPIRWAAFNGVFCMWPDSILDWPSLLFGSQCVTRHHWYHVYEILVKEKILKGRKLGSGQWNGFALFFW